RNLTFGGWSKENLSPMQERCLAILLEFDKFCIEHGIRYYLLYGTALGAVRHNGVIPWEDDVDVGLFREDYEKLIALRNNFPRTFILECFVPKGTYVYRYAKIYDTTTTVVQRLRQPIRRGVWIDIFPLDGTF